MNSFIFQLGDWTLEFPQKYRIVCDGTTAVVIDDDRTALVLLREGGNLKPPSPRSLQLYCKFENILLWRQRRVPIISLGLRAECREDISPSWDVKWRAQW